MGTTSSKVDQGSQQKQLKENGDRRFVFTDKNENISKRINDNQEEQENSVIQVQEEEKNSEFLMNNTPIIRRRSRISKAAQGEQIAAGWPSWLTAVAGEAINGWVPRRADSFEKIDKIGKGTYSDVYKARDTITGEIVALKKVRFDDLEPESVKFMAREILILRRLDHPHIVKLEGLVTSRMSYSLYLVFEYMEHDLTGIASLPGVKFTEPEVKCYTYQLLAGLEYCHSRGVLHRDIKCSNLLVDDHGKLKIADFGLSTFFDNHQNFPLTSRVTTLWYRPPELLLGQTYYGVGVDLWSTGCILGELYAGKPIMPGRTEVEQLYKIFKLCGSPSDDYWRKAKLPNATLFKPREPYRRCLAETFKDISATALGLLEILLSLEPENRGTAASALQNEFFKTEPLACNPSSLPKYPPSKEADARLIDRKAYSPRVLGAPRRYYGSQKSKNMEAYPSPDANAGTAGKMQGEKAFSPVNVPSNGFAKLFKDHKHQIQDTVQEGRLLVDEVNMKFKAQKYQKKDASQLRLARVQKFQVSERNANPEYFGPSSVSSNYKRELPEEHDHILKVAEEAARPGKIWDRLLDRVTAAEKNSGPEIVSSSYNIDELLEEHDRQIQESAQKLRHERRGATKVQMQERQIKDHSPPSVPLFVPVSNVDDLLEEHDRQIQESTQRLRMEKKKAYKF